MSARNSVELLAFVLLLTAVPSAAEAYIGPGSGISTVGSLFTVGSAIILAIAGFIWYPLKRLLAKFNGRAGRK